MKNENKTVAAILFGISFVLTLKVTELLLTYLTPTFAASDQYVVVAIAAETAALVAGGLVRKFFPEFYQ